MEFSEEIQEQFKTTIAKYPNKQAALLPALWIVQRDQGHISPKAMEYVANLLDISPSHVYSVISFYSMYQTQPIGKFHIQLCRTLSCALSGSEKIQQYLEENLNIKPGETTEDNLFTLTTVECLASCGTGPMCQINDDYYEDLTVERLGTILDTLRQQGDTP